LATFDPTENQFVSTDPVYSTLPEITRDGTACPSEVCMALRLTGANFGSLAPRASGIKPSHHDQAGKGGGSKLLAGVTGVSSPNLTPIRSILRNSSAEGPAGGRAASWMRESRRDVGWGVVMEEVERRMREGEDPMRGGGADRVGRDDDCADIVGGRRGERGGTGAGVGGDGVPESSFASRVSITSGVGGAGGGARLDDTSLFDSSLYRTFIT
jgi:hypothetical protein